MHVRFSYLKEKFSKDHAYKIFDKIWEDVVKDGSFTLGPAVKQFEETFAKLMGVKYAVGVANGTDALELALIVNGVRPGDEVIAPANTFVASLGAIGNIGAKPVLVDITHDNIIDPYLIESKITEKTKAILPVHFKGQPCEMDYIMGLSDKYNLKVIEDACQSYLASYKGRCVGSIGHAGAFSLHPLKILNVMGDGGMLTTNDENLYCEVRLLQNHGLKDRDTITRFPCRNSRLDSLHAAVANYQIMDTPGNVIKRQENAAYYDEKIRWGIKHTRKKDIKSVHHLYMIQLSNKKIRDGLYKHLLQNDIEAKIHYETPLYLQEGLKCLGHKRGDFPVADHLCDTIITIPVDELVTKEMQDYVIKNIDDYMKIHA